MRDGVRQWRESETGCEKRRTSKETSERASTISYRSGIHESLERARRGLIWNDEERKTGLERVREKGRERKERSTNGPLICEFQYRDRKRE